MRGLAVRGQEPAYTDTHMVVLEGGPEDIVSIDLRTGQEAWRIPWGAPVPGLSNNVSFVEPKTTVDGLVLIGYRNYECAPEVCIADQGPWTPELGIAAFSVSDGSLAWSVSLVAPSAEDDPSNEYLTNLYFGSATQIDGVVLVSFEVGDATSPNSLDGQPWQFTVALDPTDGSQLWQVPDFALDGRSDGEAWGTLRPEGPQEQPTPALLDPVTGEILWKDGPGKVIGVGDTAVLLKYGDNYQWRSSEGEELKGPKVTGEPDCARGPGPLVCVIGTDRRLATVADSGDVSLSPPTTYRQLFATNGEYIWAEDLGPTAERGSVAIDRNGNQLSGPKAGRAGFMIGDRVFLVREGTDSPGNELWAVTQE